MNELKFEGTWKEVKGKLKQEFAKLTNDDLQYERGADEELLGRLEKKLGKTKDEIRKIIAEI